MKILYKILLKYHNAMRDFYSNEGFFHNDMSVIFHDLRIQRYQNKIEV